MFLKSIQKKGFTLVELLVVVTILIILWGISLASLNGYSKTARNSKRISDIENIRKSLELFVLRTGKYPQPDNSQKTTYQGEKLWEQGTIGNKVIRNLSKNLSKKPIDPLHEIEYVYSITPNKREYELLTVYEGNKITWNKIIKKAQAKKHSIKIDGNYNGLFVKTNNYIFVTPSIITSEELPLEFNNNEEKIKSQIVNGGKNLPDLKIGIPSKKLQLNVKFGVYNGKINEKTNDEEKINVIKIIQNTYKNTELSDNYLQKELLSKTEDEDLLELANLLILKNKKVSSKIENKSCLGTPSGENKEFYNVSEVEAGQNCETHKKIFTCKNGVWKDGENNANTEIYKHESCLVLDPVNPSNLFLSHSSGNRQFKISFVRGSGIGNCRLQYLKNGTTWVNISGNTINCNNDTSNLSQSLGGDGWNGNWSSIKIRLVKTSDGSQLGIFNQNLVCSSKNGSNSSTPNIDEDCNGIWNNTKMQETRCPSGYNCWISGFRGTPSYSQITTQYTPGGYSTHRRECKKVGTTTPNRWGSGIYISSENKKSGSHYRCSDNTGYCWQGLQGRNGVACRNTKTIYY